MNHFDPIQFQGKLTRKRYFEGWYFKQISESTDQSIAFIPGVSLNPNDPHAFVQVIVAAPVKTFYFRYPIEAFATTSSPFSVSIGPNTFSERQISIDLSHNGTHFKGKLHFSSFQTINRSTFQPNIMGFFSYLPGMRCKHGVLSMNHYVNGSINYNHVLLTFKDDKGYLEKDWGYSFPERYIWLQANHFPEREASVMASVVTIPLLKTSFIGHLCNLQVGGKEYRFATYNQAKIIEAKQTGRHVYVTLTRGHLRLELIATLAEAGALKAPLAGEMADTIKEGLGGKLMVTLLKHEAIIFHSESAYAGIEVVKF